MTSLELPPLESPPLSFPLDELFRLQLRVARRADELARGADSDRGRDLLLWLQAERELLPRPLERGLQGVAPASEGNSRSTGAAVSPPSRGSPSPIVTEV